MKVAIFDQRMADGSRHFAGLPESQDWYAVRAHVTILPTVATHFALLLSPD